VTGTRPILFDPASNRIVVRFRDGGSIVRGATSVAVQTLSGGALASPSLGRSSRRSLFHMQMTPPKSTFAGLREGLEKGVFPDSVATLELCWGSKIVRELKELDTLGNRWHAAHHKRTVMVPG
jgi:hypothetical protein